MMNEASVGGVAQGTSRQRKHATLNTRPRKARVLIALACSLRCIRTPHSYLRAHCPRDDLSL